MPRVIVYIFAFVLGSALHVNTTFARSDMKPTAPAKMMPPGEKARLETCQLKAAQQKIKMDERARFVMDCMKEMAK